MRAALVNELPWKEEHDSLPMKKEIEALGWLPGNYTVIKPSTEAIKAEGEVLSPGDARFAEQWEKDKILKKGDKISISKEIRGDPDVLWNMEFGTSLTMHFPAQPLVQPHGCDQGSKGITRISGVMVENEACTGKAEMEGCLTREGKVVDKYSFCWQVNSMGKLEVAEKKWRRLLSGAEIEVICSAVAQRD